MATITITGKRLAAMYDNDCGLWVTPGAEERPYWANNPSWRDDYGIASMQGILDILSEQAGYEVEIDDLRKDGTVYEIVIPAVA